MYRIEFVLRGEIAYETDVDLPALDEEVIWKIFKIFAKH